MITVTLKQWVEGVGWVERDITFMKKGGYWQSNDGKMILEWKEES